MKGLKILFFICLLSSRIIAQGTSGTNLSDVGPGWANNSVNTVIFRKNSLVTYGDTQYIAYYDSAKYLIVGKRQWCENQWLTKRTKYRGRAEDAHNSIGIMVDEKGYLHITLVHHNNALRYVKSIAPGALEFHEIRGLTDEGNITYPEFYRLPDGGILFLYRYGNAGNGNLALKKYDVDRNVWESVQHNLIDGEEERSAYWQACIDPQGTIHISWVWRETWDVATNHNICYARSCDGGKTWERSTGKEYDLPVTLETAEVAKKILEGSELINQTSMAALGPDSPVIATYWRTSKKAVPQYQVVYLEDGKWKTQHVSQRRTDFTLLGGGTKKIPISRPQLLLSPSRSGKGTSALVVFRDSERGNKASVVMNNNFPHGAWKIEDLYEKNLGKWEPTFDTELWRKEGILSLFIQKVYQLDGEGLTKKNPEAIEVLDYKPF